MPEIPSRDAEQNEKIAVLDVRVTRLEVDMAEVMNTSKELTKSTSNLAGMIKVILAIALAANAAVIGLYLTKIFGS